MNGINANEVRPLIFILGNSIVPTDAMASSLSQFLSQALPIYTFIHLDPTEELPEPIPRHLVLIDTIVGLETVTAYTTLTAFSHARRTTVHDFDLLSLLPLLLKLKKIDRFSIIGVPTKGNKRILTKKIVSIIETLS